MTGYDKDNEPQQRVYIGDSDTAGTYKIDGTYTCTNRKVRIWFLKPSNKSLDYIIVGNDATTKVTEPKENVLTLDGQGYYTYYYTFTSNNEVITVNIVFKAS